MGKSIGILTAGGDSPGLNAAIRGIGKAAIRAHDMNVIGSKDGFRGLMQNRFFRLDSNALSGILTKGGTILGTSRDEPHKMDIGGKTMDMTDVMMENFEALTLDACVCLGRGGTAKKNTVAVPLEEVAGKRRVVPLDHRWIDPARSLGVGFGD